MITIQRATTSAIPQLVESRLVFLEELGQSTDEPTWQQLRQNLESFFRKTMDDGSCIAFMAYDDGEYAGGGLLIVREQPGNVKNPSGRVGYIMNMHTLASFRRKGICTMLLDALKKEAMKDGIQAFELHSTEAGAPVYTKNGFSIHSEPTYRLYL